MNKLSKIVQCTLIPAVIVSVMFLSGCATQIRPTAAQNPAPTEAFSQFNRFEMASVMLAPAYADNDTNKKALRKIQEHTTSLSTPILNSWNHAGSQQPVARTLSITPVITEIKFVGGAARFWAGAMAGSSAVIMRVTFTEKETGNVVATPEFYAVGNAMAGAWSIGGADNQMLSIIAGRMTDYMGKNYAEAVGGPTGLGQK
ncbi:outer membrane murein-binding lipoprotein Lpp [Ereboglobus sp. PH5-10]|uniref:hypothetical protein n=1 Tax=Ereboglobus sp. PH5-10 TaxID=2940629 RepID=UPI002405C083|nr:hypothetical protein [Ereboglobus sp. PH5-10]MDF9828437.1 outer membrane murein-binding lipoprotein Lpp [Ereboglobus sp. PH5-10]